MLTREDILIGLRSCTAKQFSYAVDRFVSHVEICDHLAVGELRHGGDEKSLCVRVKGDLDRAQQMITFVHEVFHIALLIHGYGDPEDEKGYEESEAMIDEAAGLFFNREPELVGYLFRQLRRLN